eukprot:361973-Chlamydomonas_euryale.AAC.4
MQTTRAASRTPTTMPRPTPVTTRTRMTRRTRATRTTTRTRPASMRRRTRLRTTRSSRKRARRRTTSQKKTSERLVALVARRTFQRLRSCGAPYVSTLAVLRRAVRFNVCGLAAFEQLPKHSLVVWAPWQCTASVCWKGVHRH